MKIIFLCGSLEPGCDGVGDYTRRLAAELLRFGHSVKAIALFDHYITEKVSEKQKIENEELSVLRIPATYSDHERYPLAKNVVDEFNPHIISLQFVIFSFQSKGLPFNLGKKLLAISQDKWHIMFHELWVGMAANDTLKHKIWGVVQKFLIRDLVKQLKPKIVHTQCTLFFEQLKKQKYKVERLPLFSNIGVYSPAQYLTGSTKQLKTSLNSLRFVLFGGLHPESKLAELIVELKKYQKKSGKELEFIYVGRNGADIQTHIRLLDENQIGYQIFGESEPEEISAILAHSSFGISTGSAEMLEKNGTVSAMIAHGLQVICIGRNLQIKGIQIPKMNGAFFISEVDDLLSGNAKKASPILLTEVAAKFIQDNVH